MGYDVTFGTESVRHPVPARGQQYSDNFTYVKPAYETDGED
jgi:hypothetical protein